MGAFDPDAFLAKMSPAPAGGFDPNAFLAKMGVAPAKQYASDVPQPGARNPSDVPLPETKSDPGIGDRIMGTLEAPFSVAVNAVGGALAPYAGVAGELVGGVNTPEGREKGKQWGTAVQKNMTYTPQTQTAKDILGYVGDKMEGVDLNAIPFAQGMTAAAMAPAAAAQVGRRVGQATQGIKDKVATMPGPVARAAAAEQKQAALVKGSFDDAGRIDAAQAAQKYSIAIDPERSNPSTRAAVRGAVLGENDVDRAMAIHNENKWATIPKKELGIPDNTALNDPKTFDAAHNAPALTQPYNQVRQIETVIMPKDLDEKMQAIKVKPLASNVDDATHANLEVTRIHDQLKEGMDGEKLLGTIRDLRQKSQDIYRHDKLGRPLVIGEKEKADAFKKIADVLEDVAGDNLPPGGKEAFQAARQQHARLYAFEKAIDPITGKADPLVWAKMIRDGQPLDGAMADLGRIAGNFPEIARVGEKPGFSWPRITRGTAPAAMGAVLGSPFGLPGIIAGTAIGGGMGFIGKRQMTKNMLTEGYQAKRAVPKDYRPINNLAPENRNALVR